MIKRIVSICCCFISVVQAQEKSTVFGLQYKPIIPAAYFDASNSSASWEGYQFNLAPKYSYSLGMVVRTELNKTFFFETGINYIDRNLQLSTVNNYISLNDYTTFSIRSYEIPYQLLTYVQVSNDVYLNVAFGFSHNIFASDVYSEGEADYQFIQNTLKRKRIQMAMLANIGAEFRTKRNGIFYVGTSLHRPWKEIGRIYPEYDDFNEQAPSTDAYYIDVLGNFLTIDFRYYFQE